MEYLAVYSTPNLYVSYLNVKLCWYLDKGVRTPGPLTYYPSSCFLASLVISCVLTKCGKPLLTPSELDPLTYYCKRTIRNELRIFLIYSQAALQIGRLYRLDQLRHIHIPLRSYSSPSIMFSHLRFHLFPFKSGKPPLVDPPCICKAIPN